ncbi:MAG TPA: nitroreductase family deazaflavin-dependent oxidoreductase [Thermomicrobiales bacterium]|nr:nitroreductase family deazaflavin-dependent oxidoreductase [Thermomicrobiales bacterium]
MAKTYRVGPFVRVTNAFMAALLRRGVEAGGNVLLTVPGRKSGEPRSTPVTILTWNGERYLQSPFGEVNWVRNLRAAGRATLSRGRRHEAISVVAVSPVEAAQVYQGTIASYPSFVRRYFDVTPDSSLEAFEAEAARHPMFRIVAAAPAEHR